MIKKILFYNSISFILLVITIIAIPLLFNANVIFFRINQYSLLLLLSSILLFLFILKDLINNELKITNENSNLVLFYFLLYLSFSTFFIADKFSYSIQKYFQYISYAIIYLFTKKLLSLNEKENQILKKVFITFFITSTIISLYAILQFYGIDPFLNKFGAITSTIGQKNLVSNYIAMILPILSYFFFTKKNKHVYYFLIVINVTALVICQSRGIWISLSLALAIVIVYIFNKNALKNVFYNKKKLLLLLLVTFALIFTIYSTDNFINKKNINVSSRAITIFDQKNPSLTARLVMWQTTLEMIRAKPLLGHGLGTFQIKYLHYQSEFLDNNPQYISYSMNPMDAHNEYLQLTAELGILGILLIVFFVWLIFKEILCYLNKNNTKNELKLLTLLLTTSIIIFLIHALFTFPLQNPATGSVFVILLGLTISLVNSNKKATYKVLFQFVNMNDMFKKATFLALFVIVIFFNINYVIKPYLSEVYYYRGMELMTEQNYSKALVQLEKSVSLNSDNGGIHHALGAAYFNIGQNQEAFLHMKKAEQNFIDKKLYRNLGLYFSKINNLAKAEYYFLKATSINPTFLQAYNDLASLYVYQENFRQAIKQWEKAIMVNQKFQEKYIFLYYIGMAYKNMNDLKNARDHFQQALREAPEDSPLIMEIQNELKTLSQSGN